MMYRIMQPPVERKVVDMAVINDAPQCARGMAQIRECVEVPIDYTEGYRSTLHLLAYLGRGTIGCRRVGEDRRHSLDAEEICVECLLFLDRHARRIYPVQ